MGTIKKASIRVIKPWIIKEKLCSFPEVSRFEDNTNLEVYFSSGVNSNPTTELINKGLQINEYIVKQVQKLLEIMNYLELLSKPKT